MKRLLVLYLISAAASAFSLCAQNITGRVIDESDIPLAYANIILQKADSTYIEGTVADTAGRFVLAAHPEAARVQITFIGYETEYRGLNDL